MSNVSRVLGTGILVGALSLSALSGCRDGEPAPAAAAVGPAIDEAAFVRHYADLVHATYLDAAAAARALADAAAAFSAAPSAEGLITTRAAWRAARTPYLRSEAFRFYDGPIDAIEPRLNGWPVDERYIDAVLDDPHAGIINNRTDRFATLSAALLAELNEKDGEKNISTGFHAIEFLLWGEDRSLSGPGNRPFTDFTAGRAGKRRGQYLRLATTALADGLDSLAAAWAPGHGDNYRARFLAAPPRTATGLILRGVGGLSGPELGGERLTVAYETKDQENEHSCFSDTTHEDVIGDLAGIANVCRGSYARATGGAPLAGPGLCALVRSVDLALGDELEARIAAAETAARALPAPFDQAILGADHAPGRAALKRLIDAVEAETETLGRVAAALGIRLSLPVLARRR